MQKLKTWFRDWLYDTSRGNKLISATEISSPRSLESDRGINFTVYKASGGIVIETRIYDRVKDRHLNSLHVVTDEQDLGAEINRIITMEALKY